MLAGSVFPALRLRRERGRTRRADLAVARRATTAMGVAGCDSDEGGIATLSRAGRLLPDDAKQRVTLLVDRLVVT